MVEAIFDTKIIVAPDNRYSADLDIAVVCDLWANIDQRTIFASGGWPLKFSKVISYNIIVYCSKQVIPFHRLQLSYCNMKALHDSKCK